MGRTICCTRKLLQDESAGVLNGKHGNSMSVQREYLPHEKQHQHRRNIFSVSTNFNMYIYTYLGVCTCVNTLIYTGIYKYVCMCLYLKTTCRHVHMYTHAYRFICMYTNTDVHAHIQNTHIDIDTYICVSICVLCNLIVIQYDVRWLAWADRGSFPFRSGPSDLLFRCYNFL